MSDSKNRHSGRSRSKTSDAERRASELQQSAARFEEAVQELARNAAKDISGRASGLIDETTRRLQQAIDGDGLGATEFEETRYARDEHRVGEGPVPTANLYLDSANRRIAGVCAGFAKYFDVEPWVARCIAVTGLVFLPTVVMPAYWVAYWLLDHEPSFESKRQRRRDKRRWRQGQRKAEKWARRGQRMASKFSNNRHQPAPERAQPSRDYSPKRILRYINADLTSAELRLRRMERHVTSNRYQLGKELNALGT